MKENDRFDIGFNNMMSSAIEYECLKRNGKQIPKELQNRLDESKKLVKWAFRRRIFKVDTLIK